MKHSISTVLSILACTALSCTRLDSTHGKTSELVFAAWSQCPEVADKAAMTRSGSRYLVNWEEGDLLTISDGTASAHFRAQSSGSHSIFTKNDGADLSEDPGTVYTAYYPASCFNDGKFVLPSGQTYMKRGVRQFPMVAISDNTELHFRSVCSILELRLSTDEDNAGAVVTEIVLESAGEALCGEVSYDFDTDAVSVSGSNTVSMVCPGGVEIGTTPTSFLFVLPAGNYAAGLKMSVYTDDASCQCVETQSGINLKRSFLHSTGVVCDEVVWDYSYGTANCINAYGQSQVIIDVTPYSVGADCFRKGPAGKAPAAESAAIVWNNDGTIISGQPVLDGNTLTVNLNSSAYGNALVAIKDGQGTVLWSYHIWKPECNPDMTIHYPLQDIDVMPMPLGALSAYQGEHSDKLTGLFYQWGRKDPMPRKGTVSKLLEQDVYAMLSPETVRQSAIAVDYASRNPSVFLCNAQATAYDWASTVSDWRNDNLWGDPKGYETPSGRKSVYDPCPEGYRVAQRNLTSTFAYDSGNIIHDADGTTFRGIKFEVSPGIWDCYLAQGYRSRSNGGVTGAGQGFYWMSSPHMAVNASAAGFNFTQAVVTPSSNRVRAYGFPLRCCK